MRSCSLREDPADLVGDRLELEHVLRRLGRADRAAHAADVQPEQVQRGDLRDERLRRGDRDLGPGVRVDDRVGLARDRRALRVADRQGARAALARVLDGHERVHGLARLADRDDERVGADHRVAVAELVRELDVDRNARPLLDRVLADRAGVRGGAAGDDDDALDAGEQLVEPVELGDDDLAVARRGRGSCSRRPRALR